MVNGVYHVLKIEISSKHLALSRPHKAKTQEGLLRVCLRSTYFAEIEDFLLKVL